MKIILPKPVTVLVVMLFAPVLGATAVQAQPEAVFNEQRSLLDLYAKAMAAEKYEEAVDYSQRVCKLSEQHLLAHPEIVGNCFDLQGQALAKLERFEEAAATFERSLAYLQRSRKVDQRKFMAVVESLAQCHWNTKQYAKSATQYERVLKYRRSSLGDFHASSLATMRDLALCYFWINDYATSEKYYRLGLKSAQTASANDPQIARWLHGVGDCRWNQQDKEGATSFYQQAHALRQKLLGPFEEDTLFSQNELIDAYEKLDRTADAEKVLLNVVAACESAGGKEAADVATAVLNLADFYQRHGREAELEPLYQRVIAIREKTFGKDHTELAGSLHEIGDIYYNRGKYADAERYHRRGLTIRENSAETDKTEVAYSHACLGLALQMSGKPREAEKQLLKARDLYQKHDADDTEVMAKTLLSLASVYEDMGRYAEAYAGAEQVLKSQTMLFGEASIELVDALLLMGNVRYEEGRYAEAEVAMRRALRIQEEHAGREAVELVFTLDNLANVLQDQRNYKESQLLRQRSLAIAQANFAPDHPTMAHLLNNLATLHEVQEQWPEAEKLYRQALKIWEDAHGKDHPNVAYGLQNVGACELQLGRLSEAEALQRRALAIREQTYGADHSLVAASQWSLVQCLIKQDRQAEAEGLLDRAITVLTRTRSTPKTLFDCYVARGKLSWKSQRKGEAVADMHRAMDLAEQIRGQSGGAEQERAQHFSQFSDVFETLLAWQVAEADASEAFAVIERSRARSLLDEMNLSGADISIGNSAEEREQLARRETELKEQISQLESQLAAAQNDEQRAELGAAIDKARGQLYEHFRDQRGTSEVYRKLLAVGGDNLRISQLQRRLGAGNSHLLVYYIGSEAGYLLSVHAGGAKLYSLAVDAKQAKTLGIEAGAVTNELLRGLLMHEKGTGIVQQLSNPKHAPPVDKLHALWQSLVPAAVQSQVLDSKTKRLVIVPDGALTLLPFETLVVTPSAVPTYLLHAGPPIAYAPSATVLYNLYERVPAARYADKPVVTVGDPTYAPAAKGGELAASSSRYGRSGGRLAPLPHTGIEAGWVSDVFMRAGMGVDKLVKADATEANLREHLGQRKIVHLACHGLIDQTFGNFFGALALTAGPDAATNPSNDGFLSLAEIYSLDLRDCELAILSACETNYGPQQEGEGTWALSRGFLVAGSRRVIASNWLVDDQSAASLVSYYCGGLAKAKANETTDYAASLQEAKRWLSKQPKWQHPYYWAALVLVGPE